MAHLVLGATIILAILQSTLVSGLDCKGRKPGYYAEVDNDCKSYLLCISSFNTKGLHFNCPPGTKFHQATQVCHHDRAVKCNDEVTDDPSNDGQEIRENIIDQKPAAKFVEQTNNFIDRNPVSQLEDSIRLKREKLTDIVLTTAQPPKPSVIPKHVKFSLKPDKKVVKSSEVKKFKVNKKTKKKEKSEKSEAARIRVNKVKEAIKEVKLDKPEHNDDDADNNCEDKLCKSSKLRKKEIRENIKLDLDKADKEVSVTQEEDSSSSFNNLNVTTAQSDSLIPQNLVDDSVISREKDSPSNNPINLTSEIRQNNKSSKQNNISEGKIDPKPKSKSKQKLSKLGYRTKPLDKLPFSQVIAAQRKTQSGEFSPYISFPELLSNITKSSRTVRMIPIAISSSEADYIRKLLRSQKRSRLRAKTNQEQGPRLPRKISKNVVDEVKHMKSAAVDDKMEYQIIYKNEPRNEREAKTDKSATSTGSNKTNNDANNSNLNTTIITVKPRGPPQGFFNKDKFKEIFTSQAGTDRDQSRVTGKTGTNLEFGFNPIKKPSKKKDIYFRKAEPEPVYFDEYLDTLQAPGYIKTVSAASVRHNSIQNSIKRSPKHFLPHIPSPLNSFIDKKQDRKSNLNFLGIFDTRKYFFIPPNRRSDTFDGQDDGIFSNLVNFFQPSL